MNFRTQVENKLRDDKNFRERKNKDAGLVRLIIARYPEFMYALGENIIKLETITEMVHDYASMDRGWRKALEENPELRGTDYDDKDRLENEAMSELGYPVPKETPPVVEAAAPEVQIPML